MTLLAPAALWLLMAGMLIIALYFLKLRRIRQTVPALDFWRDLVPQTQLRSLMKRIKRFYSLLLWLIVLLCLVLAVGNPIFTRGNMKPQTIAVIVDNSASMQTIEDSETGVTRFDLAKQAVQEMLDGRQVNDQWLLIESGHRSRVVQPLTHDRRDVGQASERLEPNAGQGDLESAIELAQQLLAGQPNPRIIVVSDGGGGDLTKLKTQFPDMVHCPIGESSDNVGITRIRVRSHRLRGEHHVLVRAVNASPDPIETEIVFSIDDNIMKVEPIQLPANGSGERLVVFDNPEGGVLKAEIDRDDSLDFDNQAFAVLEPIRPATIFLVTPPDQGFFFEQALLAMGGLLDTETSQILTPEAYEQLGEAQDLADLTIFNNCLPADCDACPRAIFVNLWPDNIPARRIGDPISTRMTVIGSDHELTRYLALSSATVARAHHVEIMEGAEVLAESEVQSPLIFVAESVNRKAVCIAFDLLDSDLPVRNGFPILLRNAIGYFAYQPSQWIEPDYPIGSTIRLLQPAPSQLNSVTATRIVDGETVESTLAVTNRQISFDETSEPGPVRFDLGDESAYTSVNLTSEKESRTGPVILPDSTDSPLELSSRLAGMSPWLMMAIAGTMLIVLEWFTFHHRITE